MYEIDEEGREIQLTNFVVRVLQETVVVGAEETGRKIKLELRWARGRRRFWIGSDDFSSLGSLKQALVREGGTALVFHGSVSKLQQAITALRDPDSPVSHETRDFGWTVDGTAYLTPSGRITAFGHEAAKYAGIRVVLPDGGPQAGLDLQPLGEKDLATAKKHVVEDLLRLHDREVTYSLFGAVGAAIIWKFIPDHGRFNLWVHGATGCGKSFLTRLIAHFFGQFPDGSSIASWTSTKNRLEEIGYHHKDAIYPIDDFKASTTDQRQVISLLQNAADGTGRARMTSSTRPVRGLLVANGEAPPPGMESVLARTIAIEVPAREKDVVKGGRCRAMREAYSGITLDFVRWLLAEGFPAKYEAVFSRIRQRFLDVIAGKCSNDARIAGNHAVLLIGFAHMAYNLRNVWPAWHEEVLWFHDHLGEKLQGMAVTSSSMADWQKFLDGLAALQSHGKVRFRGEEGGGAIVGRKLGGGVLAIATGLALRKVKEYWQAMGDPMEAGAGQLYRQLKEQGILLNRDGDPLKTGDASTVQFRFETDRQQCILLPEKVFRGDESIAAAA